MAKTYTVKAGDTLYKIARDHSSDIAGKTTAAKVDTLVKINDITNKNYIVIGQVLKLSGSATTAKKSTSNTVSIKLFGIQSGTDRTLYITWNWTKDHTKEYKVKWTYYTGDSVWFVGSETTVTAKQATWSPPENAKQVRCIVKPVSTEKNSKTKSVYWTGNWSTARTYKFGEVPSKPSTPSLEVDGLKLTCRMDNLLNLNASDIRFELVKNDTTKCHTPDVTISKTGVASFTYTGNAGCDYKVRCRAWKGKKDNCSEWTDFSSNVSTYPTAPKKVTVKAKKIITPGMDDVTGILVSWAETKNAVGYDIEYANNADYFDSSSSTSTESVEGGNVTTRFLTLNYGYWVFRVRAKNDKGELSPWSKIVSFRLGEKPSAPTTWSSSTNVIAGEDLTLYWVHNTVDGSSQTFAKLQLYIDNSSTPTQYIIPNTARYGISASGKVYKISDFENDDDKDATSVFVINTGYYKEGATIKWKVATKGVLYDSDDDEDPNSDYGEFSIVRTVDIYAPPTVDLNLKTQDGEVTNTFQSFPVCVEALAGPDTQKPIGYHISVMSTESYDTVDQMGNDQKINANTTVYSKYFDVKDNPLKVTLSAADIDLENNVEYKVKCVVAMDSGLSAESETDLIVNWTDIEYAPSAEISIDMDTLEANIRPYCGYYPEIYHKVVYDSSADMYYFHAETIDKDTIIEGAPMEGDIATATYEPVYVGKLADNSTIYYTIVEGDELELIEDVTLSVYRREPDGSFTEIETGIENNSMTVVDPHPALNYARYRIVSVTNSTGAVSYSDVEEYIGEKAIVLRWDEEWSNFFIYETGEFEQPSLTGSMLKLPYNIDISDKTTPDVELVAYAGREHPVSYYGTQLGVTGSWSAEIDKKDEETIYSLRRLSRWMGDVYVREPSGTGYWAHITVHFKQTHLQTTIPVSLEITRVEGGM